MGTAAKRLACVFAMTIILLLVGAKVKVSRSHGVGRGLPTYVLRM